MNDISLKIVESPKSQAGIPVSPSTLAIGENEVDPLAIDDEVGAIKDPLVEEPAVETPNEEKAGNCDENAKEKSLEEKPFVDGDKTNVVQKDETSDETQSRESPSVLLTSGTVDAAVKDDVVVEEVPKTAPVQTEEAVKPSPVEEPVKESVVIAQVKEPSPVKEKPVEEAKVQPTTPNVDMIQAPPAEEKIEPPVESKRKPPPMNGDISKDEQGIKRRCSEEVETESPLKRLCQEVEKTFPQHDTMINDYIQTATKNNIDEIQRHMEQLLSEIQTLRELAQKKEHEWNNILHLKKVKEEILLRLLRRKQVLSFEKSAEVNGSDRTDPFDFLNQPKNLAIDKSDEISGLSLKQPGSTITPIIQPPVLPVTSHFNPLAGLPPPYDKASHMQNMPKPVFPQPMMMPGPLPGFPRDMNGQLPTSFGLPMGRQGPTKDVKSIIADYRQRNPEVTPRRGRRMKSILNPNMMNTPRPIAPKVDNMNNMNNINMFYNNLDMVSHNQKTLLERLIVKAGGLPNGPSFKDVLIQFANMQQTNNLLPNRPVETITNRPEHHVRPERRQRQERSEEIHKAERIAASSPRLPPPPPYPEISLLPVTTSQDTSQQNSLLHGILTKNCGEITITPVQPTPPPEPQPEKTEEVVQLDDEESPASEGEASGSPAGSGSGRLVIDEGGAAGGGGGAGGAGGADDAPDAERDSAGSGDAGEPGDGGADADAGDAPLCQGCRRRDAQFVCAGCANQWYCSRDCQVAAWDEHSEMCSG
ncbi:uncharacterized protein LOC115445247 isoform X2 [Manduca sexta]|uniref:uncharacterized protein LOC115445247 isoform X2 n=1 Tax=Manduca sexta TaxID=7130 RepID=UPI00188DDA33|nr:uncharacterized protein LOC115445247 isoform X2 [Manduca sexta]